MDANQQQPTPAPEYDQQLIRLCDVPHRVRWLPQRRNGKKLSISTVFRWATRGVQGRKLQTVRFGGAMCTCESWLWEFASATSGSASPGHLQGPAERTMAQRRRSVQLAKATLDKAGI